MILLSRPDGKYAANDSDDGTVGVWNRDKPSGYERRGLDHGGWVIAIAFGPEG